MKTYEYFTTSDGHRYAVEIKPIQPDWTPRQQRLARNSLTIGITFLYALVGLLGIFIGYKLFGG